MKLAGAKRVLEDKYNEMVKLITFLTFFRSMGAELH